MRIYHAIIAYAFVHMYTAKCRNWMGLIMLSIYLAVIWLVIGALLVCITYPARAYLHNNRARALRDVMRATIYAYLCGARATQQHTLLLAHCGSASRTYSRVKCTHDNVPAGVLVLDVCLCFLIHVREMPAPAASSQQPASSSLSHMLGGCKSHTERPSTSIALSMFAARQQTR